MSYKTTRFQRKTIANSLKPLFYYFCILITFDMPIIRPLRGISPKIGKNCFIAENAVIIGDVTIGDNCSIWYNVVLRGDVNTIKIGNNTNIQDGVVIHTLYQRSITEIGDNVSVGHNATVHGACVKDNVLVGMGATLLDNSVVNEYTIIAANALITAGSILDSHSIYGGVPAKKIKELSPEQAKEIIIRTANGYRMYATWYDESLTL